MRNPREAAEKRERHLAKEVGSLHSDGTPNQMGVLGSLERVAHLRRGGETPTAPNVNRGDKLARQS
jgi:hypothetical protein